MASFLRKKDVVKATFSKITQKESVFSNPHSSDFVQFNLILCCFELLLRWVVGKDCHSSRSDSHEYPQF